MNPYKSDGPAEHAFHLMAKPAGPVCNISCEYCFYKEKKTFFPDDAVLCMSQEILEVYTREYIRAQPGPFVLFDWQGGEPTLMGLDFFQTALDFQKKYADGKQITNTLQTNGTLIDEAWCSFLSKNGFLVGLSMDGPEFVHDSYRVYSDGKPTFAKVFDSYKMMMKHGVEVNVLATVNRKSSYNPLEVYRFFRESGVKFIQFIPIVEREAGCEYENNRLPFAAPPYFSKKISSSAVTRCSVDPEQYGEFLIRIFDEWIREDVGRIFVMNFEWALGSWARVVAGVCYLAPCCGQNMIIEHNGDVFSCDHFMYPDYRLGNILDDSLKSMVESRKQMEFGTSKKMNLSRHCLSCDFLFACNGGCPKHRFSATPDGDPGLNYLCKGLKKFYRHVDPSMKRMLKLIRSGVPAHKIMKSEN